MSGVTVSGTSGGGNYCLMVVTESSLANESTKLTYRILGTGSGIPLVSTDSGRDRNRHISSNVSNLYGIDSGAVFYLVINDRNTLTNVKYVLNAYDEIEDSILAAVCNNGIAEEELAFLVRCLNGDGIRYGWKRNFSIADVTSAAEILIYVIGGFFSCSAFTLVVVTDSVGLPHVGKDVSVSTLYVLRSIATGKIVLESKCTGRKREQKDH